MKLEIVGNLGLLSTQTLFFCKSRRMGDAGAFANTRNRVRPPDKGSFPIDHKGVCQCMRDAWANCMKANAWDSGKCRAESAAYLRCRIENNLMKPEEIAKLGFNKIEWDKGGEIFAKK